MYFLRDFPRWPNQTDGNTTEIQQKPTNPSKLRQNCSEIPTPTTNEPLKPRQYTYLPTLHPLGTPILPSTTLEKAQNFTILLKNHDFWLKSYNSLLATRTASTTDSLHHHRGDHKIYQKSIKNQ